MCPAVQFVAARPTAVEEFRTDLLDRQFEGVGGASNPSPRNQSLADVQQSQPHEAERPLERVRAVVVAQVHGRARFLQRLVECRALALGHS